jgi:hypothetical protein
MVLRFFFVRTFARSHFGSFFLGSRGSRDRGVLIGSDETTASGHSMVTPASLQLATPERERERKLTRSRLANRVFRVRCKFAKARLHQFWAGRRAFSVFGDRSGDAKRREICRPYAEAAAAAGCPLVGLEKLQADARLSSRRIIECSDVVITSLYVSAPYSTPDIRNTGFQLRILPFCSLYRGYVLVHSAKPSNHT